jgi:hypothetical protein
VFSRSWTAVGNGLLASLKVSIATVWLVRGGPGWFRNLASVPQTPGRRHIQAQLSGDLLSNDQTVSLPSIDVDFLKNENIRIRIAEALPLSSNTLVSN